MNIRDIQNGKYRRITLAQSHARRLSRRQFVRGAAGAAALSVAIGSGLWRSGVAEAKGSAGPVPIPHGTPALGGAYRLFGPTPDGSFDPIDAEPSTVGDFNGFVGLTYVSGMVTRTNTVTHDVQRLPFIGSDMRFMKGDYRGTDGQVHQGAFALI